MKYQSITATSSTVNVGNIAYGGGGQVGYVQETVLKGEQRDKREYRDELHHDLMASMMQQHQGNSIYYYV